MKKFLTIFGNTILVILIAIGILIGFSLLPIKNNYKIYFVTSGSMEPTITTGSMVVSKPQDSYVAGNIITFKNIGSSKPNDTTTHRISEVNLDDNGNLIYATKGDANNSNDGEKLSSDRIVGRMIFSLPLIGYLIGYIKTLPGLVLIVIIPATIIIYEEIKKMRNEAREIIKRRRTRKKETVKDLYEEQKKPGINVAEKSSKKISGNNKTEKKGEKNE